MKKFLAIFAILSLSVAAWAGDGSELFKVNKSVKMDQNSVYGFWSAPDQNNSGIKFGIRFKFDHQKVVTAIRCDLGSNVKFAEVEVPANITATTIEILADAKSGDRTCNVSAHKTPATSYSVHLGYMNITGVPVQFEKLQDL